MQNALWCSAGTFTWNGSVNSDWFTADNWTPAGVPAASDTVNFTTGTIDLLGPVTIDGTFNWSGGTLSGIGMTIASSGALNITGNVNMYSPLTNAGTVTMSGPANLGMLNNHTANYTGSVYNQAGALWNIQTNAGISGQSGYGYEYFNNAGNLLKSLGANTANMSVSFTNTLTGTVSNLAGTISFNQGGVLVGVYDTAANTTIEFASGNFTVDISPGITGGGICEFAGSTLTLNEDSPANLVLAGGSLILGPAFQNLGAITNLTLSGSTLAGTNTVTGTLTCDAATLAGPLTIESGGMLNIAGSVNLYGLLTNAGTVTMTGNGNLGMLNNHSASYSGSVYNLAGALWNIQTNAGLSGQSGYGYEYFNNAGNVLKSLGADTANISVSFTNTASGTVSNLAGTLSFNAGGVLTGDYDVAADAIIYFASGSFSVGVSPVITGAGLCEFTGSTLTLRQDVVPNLPVTGGSLVLGPGFQNMGAITNLTLEGSTLAGTNTVTGALTLDTGTIPGPLTIESGAMLNIVGNVTLYSVLTNAGTVTMTGSANLGMLNNHTPSYTGSVYNLAGALWNIQTNAGLSGQSGYGYEYFINAGNFLKSQGADTANIAVSFTNTTTGTVSNLAGTLSFNGGGVLAGAYDVATNAIIDFSAGNFTMSVPPVVTGAGLFEFTGSTLMLTEDVLSNLALAGGSLVLGPGFQNLGAITNLTLKGSALEGTNTVTGMLTLDTGTLANPLTIESGGTLNIAGNVTLYSVLTNAGTVTMTGSANLGMLNNHTPSYTGSVYNLPGALWNIETNAGLSGQSGYGYEYFNNAGNFLKSLGADTANVSVSFTNTATGTVSNLAGTLSFNGGGVLAGDYDVATNAIIYFSAGNFTMGVPPVITGAGLCEFAGSMLTMTENVPPNLLLSGGDLVLGPGFQNLGAISNLTLNGSILTGTNTVTGTLRMDSGTIAGPLTIENGGMLDIAGNISLYGVLTNAGAVTMTGTPTLGMYNNHTAPYSGGVYNQAGALWNIQTNANFAGQSGYGYEYFNNAGNFLKSLGSDTANVSVSFTNAGTVDAQAGFLSFNSSFTTIGGTLAFGVNSTSSYGQIYVSGALALNGTANVTWLDGFTPAISNSFGLLHYGSESGTFANITLPSGYLGEGNYGATVFSLLVTGLGT
ncbi:MAG TPA: hypothetical protein VGR14_19740, partial [Verrucomicrobiae bacterium]|nr:hypothetical protein [Verrucomicrobiae bacterium]